MFCFLFYLQVESSKATAPGASWDESKSRFRARPSLRSRGAALTQPPAASPRPASLSTRQRQATLGRDECRISRAAGTPQAKQKSTAGRTNNLCLTVLNTHHVLGVYPVKLSW